MKELLEQYYFPKDEIEGLIKKFGEGELTKEDNRLKGEVHPPAQDAFKILPQKDSHEYNKLYDLGMQAIERGELGVVVLNGGMATRFGGVVKGIVEVFDGKSFLELKIRSALRISDKLRFFIMNSFSTEEATKDHFTEKNYFAIPERIKMFNQFIAPRITKDGKYFLNLKSRDSFYGPGHGDFPYAFRRSGLLDEFVNAGGKYLFYSNVDNLGARVDPALLGFHIVNNAEITAEVAPKSPGDEGGAPAVVDGKLRLVEGFCFPEDFDQSSIPVFNCSTYWANAESLKKDFILPWYVVEKKVNGTEVIQFEHLAGDLSIFLETNYIKVPRNERFFPVKRPEDLEKERESLKKITVS